MCVCVRERESVRAVCVVARASVRARVALRIHCAKRMRRSLLLSVVSSSTVFFDSI